ncbi:MAG: hypothetical protein N3D79_06510, partial [Acidilobaceae archaeon]|nr:hypothetical protein [Acidilobaceae archaeon]
LPLLLLLALLTSVTAVVATAEEAPAITGKYFELELRRFPLTEQDRFYILMGVVNTAWPRTLAIAPRDDRDGNAFFHLKIYNHMLYIENETHSLRMPLSKYVRVELEYRFAEWDLGNAWWLRVKVYAYMNLSPSRVLVYESPVRFPMHTEIRIISSHDIAVVPLGNWSIKYYDFSPRPLPPLPKQSSTPRPAPTSPREPGFISACQLALNFPEPRFSTEFIGELASWFGGVGSCIISVSTTFLSAILTLSTIVFLHLPVLPLLWILIFIYLLVTDPPRSLELVLRTFRLIFDIVQFFVTLLVRVAHVLAEAIPL